MKRIYIAPFIYYVSELHAGRVDPRVGSGRVGSGQKIYRYEWVGSGPVRLMTKCIVKFCDACHIIHYNNELKKFHVVFYVYGDQAM